MPFSDEQLREIGRVVAVFNRLELFLRYVLSNLMTEDEEIGLALTAGDSFRVLHDKLTLLIPVRVKDAELRDRLKKLLRLADQANKPQSRHCSFDMARVGATIGGMGVP
jgi:hypothetical protein